VVSFCAGSPTRRRARICPGTGPHAEPHYSTKMRKYHYYEVLEISREATQEDISTAFRRLARVWHPDLNPGSQEAETTFRRINSAYQVLVNEKTRAEYDRSSVECPTCGTHEVLTMNDNRWQCKHCGCRFDVSGSPELYAIDAPSSPPLRRARFRAFQATQCSWCALFYNREPSLCPHQSPQTNCDAFKAINESQRRTYLANAAWPALVDEWLRPSAERGLVKKCTTCGALNPNPSHMSEPCWNCHRPLRDECPHCGAPMLFYDIEQGTWRCANNQCSGRSFSFDSDTNEWNMTVHHAPPPPRSRQRRPPPSRPDCPHCGAGLIYSDVQSMWCCVVCRRLYTPEQAGFAAPQDAPIPEWRSHKRRGSAARSERPRAERPRRTRRPPEPTIGPRRKKSTGDYALLAAAIGLILIIGTVVIMGLTGRI